VHRYATSTSVIMFAEEHSLRVSAVHFTKAQPKCRLSDVAGICMLQSAGTQRYQTTGLQEHS